MNDEDAKLLETRVYTTEEAATFAGLPLGAFVNLILAAEFPDWKVAKEDE